MQEKNLIDNSNFEKKNRLDTADYTFPPDKLWYRGRTSTNQDGEYEFNTTYPAIYKSRAIPHIHYKVPKLH